LLAADWEKAFAFYREVFGWQKADADTGAMGTYQLFSAAGETIRRHVHQACDGAGPVLATSTSAISTWQ
jgi:predicted enzyme related to lactoylglutathione lyase